MCEQHLDLLSLSARDDVGLGGRDLSANITRTQTLVLDDELAYVITYEPFTLTAVALRMTFEPTFSEIEHDALTELLNIGVGRAAAALSQMLHKHVNLNVPSFDITTPVRAKALLKASDEPGFVAVHEDVSGAFAGRAFMIFPAPSSDGIVQAILDGKVPAEDVAGLHAEALIEIGNVILNRCLGALANMLERPLTFTLPTLVEGQSSEVLSYDIAAESDAILFFHISFSVRDLDARGYLVMMLDLPSLISLRSLVQEYLDRAGIPY